MRSPGGYVPAEVKARPKKVWQQGLAMDFDTLSPRRLDDFDYAITTPAKPSGTTAAELRSGGPNSSYVLWRRSGPTPPLGVIDKTAPRVGSSTAPSLQGGRLARARAPRR